MPYITYHTGEFVAQMACKAENVSIWWCLDENRDLFWMWKHSFMYGIYGKWYSWFVDFYIQNLYWYVLLYGPFSIYYSSTIFMVDKFTYVCTTERKQFWQYVSVSDFVKYNFISDNIIQKLLNCIKSIRSSESNSRYHVILVCLSLYHACNTVMFPSDALDIDKLNGCVSAVL